MLYYCKLSAPDNRLSTKYGKTHTGVKGCDVVPSSLPLPHVLVAVAGKEEETFPFKFLSDQSSKRKLFLKEFSWLRDTVCVVHQVSRQQ